MTSDVEGLIIQMLQDGFDRQEKRGDKLEEKLDKAISCISDHETRLTAVERRNGNGNGNGKKAAPAPDWQAFTLSLLKYFLAAVVLGGVLILGYVEVVLPKLEALGK